MPPALAGVNRLRNDWASITRVVSSSGSRVVMAPIKERAPAGKPRAAIRSTTGA